MWIKLILLLFLAGCAGTPIDYKLSPEIVSQMNEVYNPLVEKGFCVSDKVYNVQTWWLSFICPMPVCKPESIVFHTHPILTEPGANFFDLAMFEEYNRCYGNTLFGVMYGKGRYKVYEVNN